MTTVDHTELLTPLEISQTKIRVCGSTLDSLKEDGKWRRRSWQLFAVLSGNFYQLN